MRLTVLAAATILAMSGAAAEPIGTTEVRVADGASRPTSSPRPGRAGP
jgi:hypothetical protein